MNLSRFLSVLMVMKVLFLAATINAYDFRINVRIVVPAYP